MAQERENQGWNLESDRERHERHLREHNAALRIQEEMLLNERPGDVAVAFAFTLAAGLEVVLSAAACALTT